MGKATKTNITDFHIKEKPFYYPIDNEVDIFRKAYQQRLPVALKGPTGTGKTRFLEYMAYTLGKPLITIACHEDLTAADLIGRFILKGDETIWQDGPLTTAAKIGAICYLDEVVEARKDTVAFIHPLTDHRRILPIDKLGTQIKAHDDFLVTISYNPGYQTMAKDLKPSTKQRFIGIEFGFPDNASEKKIVAGETGFKDDKLISKVVLLATNIRAGREDILSVLDELPSSRLLIYSIKLMQSGLKFDEACRVGIVNSLTDDRTTQKALNAYVENI